MGYHRKKETTDGQIERERGRENAVLYEKGGYMPDRCRECWNYIRKVLIAIWADEHHWTVHCVSSSEALFTHVYKYPPQMSFHLLLLFCYFYFALGLHVHVSADCWSAHRSPAARDSFKHVHDWCKAGWRRPSAPQTKILATPVVGPGMIGNKYYAVHSCLHVPRGFVRDGKRHHWLFF